MFDSGGIENIILDDCIIDVHYIDTVRTTINKRTIGDKNPISACSIM